MTATDWIDASQALPPAQNWVLAIDQIGLYHVCRWRESGWFGKSIGISKETNIRYWMPLPKPPADLELESELTNDLFAIAREEGRTS